MNHEEAYHEQCNNMACYTCNLYVCKNCGAYEGSLTTDCPNVRVNMDVQDAVYKGKVDFIGDSWVLTDYKHPFERNLHLSYKETEVDTEKISSSWTKEERDRLIEKLQNELAWHMKDIQERIRFIKSATASFLELNRETIINGFPKPEGDKQ